jgi:hypothetical protein
MLAAPPLPVSRKRLQKLLHLDRLAPHFEASGGDLRRRRVLWFTRRFFLGGRLQHRICRTRPSSILRLRPGHSRLRPTRKYRSNEQHCERKKRRNQDATESDSHKLSLPEDDSLLYSRILFSMCERTKPEAVQPGSGPTLDGSGRLRQRRVGWRAFAGEANSPYVQRTRSN